MSKLVVSITHAKDNPELASLGLMIACAGAASGAETVVFLSTEGAYLSQSGYADAIHETGFAPLAEMIADFIANNGAIWVCSPCFRRRDLLEERLLPNTLIVGGARLVEFLSQGASCISY